MTERDLWKLGVLVALASLYLGLMASLPAPPTAAEIPAAIEPAPPPVVARRRPAVTTPRPVRIQPVRRKRVRTRSS